MANVARLGISVHCLFSVRSHDLIWLVLDYRWSHNPLNYRRAITPNWYRTHTVPKFGLQSSRITGLPSMRYVRSKGEGGSQGKSVHYCFHHVILLFKSVQMGRGCLKITKFERTNFIDGSCFISSLGRLLKVNTKISN